MFQAMQCSCEAITFQTDMTDCVVDYKFASSTTALLIY